jgi:three-Cys-motif partner protein
LEIDVTAEHRFGGIWTELKLEAISAYSEFFTGAIGGRFDLWYVDPFAGTGSRTAEEQVGGLFDGRPISIIEKRYPGSAARALSIEPPFGHLRFGDTKKSHIKALPVIRPKLSCCRSGPRFACRLRPGQQPSSTASVRPHPLGNQRDKR